MKTTLNIDPDLLDTTMRLAGYTKKTAFITALLKEKLRREVALQLADLGGSEPGLLPDCDGMVIQG